MCNNDSGLSEWKAIDTHTKIGYGKLLKAAKICKVKLVIKPNLGTETNVTLYDVK